MQVTSDNLGKSESTLNEPDGTQGDQTEIWASKFGPWFVFEPVAYWAQTCPNRTALVSHEVAWTYSDLERRSNQIARVLRTRGIAKGDRVAFVLPRGPRAILILLSILKAGAAYVPLDSDSPPTRIKECLEDASPSLIIVAGDQVSSNVEFPEGVPVLSADWLFTDSLLVDAAPIDAADRRLDPTDIAYIIFTSGSTGRPKGVPITHAGLANFISGDQAVCIRVEQDDQVFQGFSPASDGHHEEVWPTFFAGATLIVATSREVHSGPELKSFLTDHQVSIISCAPTLLSMVDGDIPSVRRILFGAENLPATIVERWWKPGREIINTYGPTEATVGATFGYCDPDSPITIGKPLPNYQCYVVDEANGKVVDGEEGQLAIAGIGVSSGYFGRSDLSLGRFIPNPFFDSELKNPTLYLTGDRVRRDTITGNLIWLGRIDSQIKIRGHRVELSEIESHVLAFPSINSATVVARTTSDHLVQLVALVVLKSGVEFSMAAFLDQMRSGLPSYMVPQLVELVDRIPVLPSGKVDRKSCQTLHGQPVRIDREVIPPRSETERMLLQQWQGLFGVEEISCADDFFTDLGGHSLLASRFISQLRGDKGLGNVSVVDVYGNPTIRSFAAHLDSSVEGAPDRPEFRAVDAQRFRSAKLVQAAGVLTLFGIQSFLWLGPIVCAIYFSDIGYTEASSVLLGLAIRAAMVPIVLGLVVVLKWTVVGKFKEGRYPLWGGVFLRWWFLGRLLASAPSGFLTGTPFAAMYLRLMGAKIGKNVILESLDIDCPDVISIGDNCNFENSTWIHAAEVSQGELHIHPVRIANGCTLGVRSGVAGGAVLEEGATLRDLTCVSAGVVVPKGEEWSGSPGRKCAQKLIPEYDARQQPSQGRWFVFGSIQFLLILLLTMLDSIPFVVIGFTLYSVSEGASYLWEPVYAIGLVLFAMVQALFVKWVVMGRLKPGTYPFPSPYWIRKWFSDKHLELISGVIVPVYDSLFARAWCVALGMKCGPRCEIALPRRMPYDLVEMGEESFLASEVSIGMPIRRNGTLFLERTIVGKRVFLGNDSVLPQGTTVPEESLLGVLSIWPPLSEAGAADHQAWLGSPAFRMPNRDVHNEFDIRQTYHPTRKLYLERLAHEAFRLVLPSLCSLVIASIFLESFTAIWNEASLRVAIIATPYLYLLVSVLAAVMCRISKSLLVGKYTPTVSPLWSSFVWKAETYSAVLHDFGVPVFIQMIVGTPFLAWLMRFLGAKVGKRTFINSTDWTETDLITIGHDVAINTNAPLQAHLFEDRVMKVGAIRIGDRASVGHYSVILCDSELRNDANVGHLSLVMKGETIPSHTFWVGAPVQVGRDSVKSYEQSQSASRLANQIEGN